MMGWLRVVGMVPPEPSTYWSEGTFEAWPADRSKMDWADGARRAAFPITGTLAGGGTRFGSTREAGDVYVPGANIGDSIDPPVLEIIVRLRDGIMGEWKEFRGVGKVVATAPGEWNINAPLGGVMTYVNTPGVPAGALTQADLGGSVARVEDLNNALGRLNALEAEIHVVEINGRTNASPAYDSYPWGVSFQNIANGTADGWPMDYGQVKTVKLAEDPLGTHQWFYAFNGRTWYRGPKAPRGSGDQSWRDWEEENRLVSRTELYNGDVVVRRYSNGDQEVTGNRVFFVGGGGGGFNVEWAAMPFLGVPSAISVINGDVNAGKYHFDVYSYGTQFMHISALGLAPGGVSFTPNDNSAIRVIFRVLGRWR